VPVFHCGQASALSVSEANKGHVRDRTDLIKHMLSIPFFKDRIGKWLFALSEFSFNYLPQQSVKGKVLALFFIKNKSFLGKQLPDQDDEEVIRLTTTPWQIHFDGSSTQGGAGAGIAFFFLS
jgi:hypothetical protein